VVAARTTYLLHGGDPAPGDPAAARRMVGRLRSAVDSVADAANLIRGIGTDRDMWTGTGADAFAHKLNELLRRLSTAQAAYESAADALSRWTSRLEAAQHEAASIVSRAQAAAHAAAAQTGGHLVGRPPALVALQHARDTLERRARADARTCAHALEAASQQVGHFHHSLRQQMDQNWHGFLDDLDVVSKVLHHVSEALAVITLVTAFIPVVNAATPVLELLTLASTVAMTAADVTLAASGRRQWTVVAEDGVGLALGGAGKVAGRIFKQAKAAEQFGASAKEARGLATGFGRELRQAEVRWVTGQGSLDEAALMGKLRGTARADAAELRSLAREAQSESGLGAALRQVAQDPAGFAEAAEAKAVKDAAQYFKLPGLAQWFPSDRGEAIAFGIDHGLEGSDLWNAPRDISKTVDWVRRVLDGTWDPASEAPR
jgi:uncharacterized protein YukE